MADRWANEGVEEAQVLRIERARGQGRVGEGEGDGREVWKKVVFWGSEQ